jgi:hypothetical protein
MDLIKSIKKWGLKTSRLYSLNVDLKSLKSKHIRSNMLEKSKNLLLKFLM